MRTAKFLFHASIISLHVSCMTEGVICICAKQRELARAHTHVYRDSYLCKTFNNHVTSLRLERVNIVNISTFANTCILFPLFAKYFWMFHVTNLYNYLKTKFLDSFKKRVSCNPSHMGQWNKVCVCEHDCLQVRSGLTAVIVIPLFLS